MPGWEEVAPSPRTFVARAEPPAPKLAPSSICVGSVLGALAGDAPRGGVVDGGGMLGVALCGSSCCCPPPATTARSAPRNRAPNTRRRGVSGELMLGAVPGAAIRASQHHQRCTGNPCRGLAARRSPGPLHPLGQCLHVPARMKTNQEKWHGLARQR